MSATAPDHRLRDLFPLLTDHARLTAAFGAVATAGGAPGVDGVSVAGYGEELDERVAALASAVAAGTWEPSELLAVRMPKDRDPRGRELLIPCVGDRLLLRAIHELLSDAVDARLLPCVHGFRAGHSVRRAVSACQTAVRTRPWVADADIRDFFASVPHRLVTETLAAWVDDERLIALIGRAIMAPVVRAGRREEREAGLPLGSPLSPLLANVVLHPLDVALWRADTTYIRFADDFVICCEQQALADRQLETSRAVLDDLGLSLHTGKSRVVDTRRESLIFLGHLVRSDPGGTGEASVERPSRRTLHIVETGAKLCSRRGRLVVQRGGTEILSVPVRRVRDIVVLAPIEVTSGAMTACLQQGIDVHWLSEHGRAWGALRTWRSPSPELRRIQMATSLDPRRSLELGRTFVAAKVANQKRLLQRQKARTVGAVLARALEAVSVAAASVAHAANRSALMGAEGAAGRAFFDGLACCVAPELGFSGRVRRPPTDPVNALLSFGYTLLTNEVASAAWRSGLDADVGFLHQARTGRPSLALDLVEEFRSTVVDALVLSVLHRRVLRLEHFVADPATGGVRLTDDGRRQFIGEYELRMLTRFTHEPTGDRVSYRRATVLQAEQLARVLRHPGTPYLAVRLT